MPRRGRRSGSADSASRSTRSPWRNTAPSWTPSSNSEESGGYWKILDGRIVEPRTGVSWLPEWPVISVSWNDAMAYCKWRSAVEGRAITLPTSREWERAARGADGRRRPWGEGYDWAWALTGKHPAHPEGVEPNPKPVGTAVRDVSPFGVHDMAGSQTAMSPRSGCTTWPAARRSGAWIRPSPGPTCGGSTAGPGPA
ncbi:MAG: formylglycine-generating enzyme family protein [Planctomycetota bacterium]